MQSSIKLHAGPPAPLGADRISKPIHAPARFPAGLRFEGYGAFDCDVAVDGEVHNRIIVPEPTKSWAKVALDRMLELA